MIKRAFNITNDHCAEVDALIKENPIRLSVIMKFRTWCMCGFDHNQKLPLQMGSKGL
jgi:hypothetical protein